MVSLRENFLAQYGNRFNLNLSLPLRLQKRQLLRYLGLPGNKDLIPCPASEKKQVLSLFKKYSSMGFPFLVLVSEKPSPKRISPLFLVNDENNIIWRDDEGKKEGITQAAALRIISDYYQSAWLEFSNYIWGPATVAGRLIYTDLDRQDIELQMGVIPSQLLFLDGSREIPPVYSGTLSFFNLEPMNYCEDADNLRHTGYSRLFSFTTVRKIARSLGSCCYEGFQELAKIAPLPTLEFGIVRSQRYIFIDIDWPSQWKER